MRYTLLISLVLLMGQIFCKVAGAFKQLRLSENLRDVMNPARASVRTLSGAAPLVSNEFE